MSNTPVHDRLAREYQAPPRLRPAVRALARITATGITLFVGGFLFGLFLAACYIAGDVL